MATIKRTIIAVFFSILAAFINIFPLVMQKQNFYVILSAFIAWIVSGFFISNTPLKIKGTIKGIVISVLVFAPNLVFVSEYGLISFIWDAAMVVILGGLIGMLAEKLSN